LATAAIAFLAVSAVSCDSNKTSNKMGDGGPGDDLSAISTDDGGSDDLAVIDVDAFIAEHDLAQLPPIMCVGGAGCPCMTGADCNSGICDATNKVCIDLTCGNANDPCVTSADCCGLVCVSKKCGGQCIADNQPCSVDADCCSTLCTNSADGGAGKTCKSLTGPGQCKTAGNPCSGPDAGTAMSTECCSKVCTANHQCAPPRQVSYCTQINDICHADSECCTGVCNLIPGTRVGTCASINTTCTVDGLSCNGCGSCCSRFCGPFGSIGSNICQPASGCHVLGDTCRTNKDCCGGDQTQTLPGPNGTGQVVCVPDPTYPTKIGTCGAPSHTNCPPDTYMPSVNCKNNCIPTGDICHLNPAPACGANVSINADCCQCVSTKDCCKPDHAGIPRCNFVGGCVAQGGSCTSAADCCAGPCIPDATGSLHCLSAPDGGITCQPETKPCTTNSDCCLGLLCIVPPGSIQGTCTNPTPPPPPDMANAPDLAGVPPADLAGVPPVDMATAPICSQYGQGCSTKVPCCDGVTCLDATSGAACASNNTASCLCFLNIP
jgi:hypothetical protein